MQYITVEGAVWPHECRQRGRLDIGSASEVCAIRLDGGSSLLCLEWYIDGKEFREWLLLLRLFSFERSDRMQLKGLYKR